MKKLLLMLPLLAMACSEPKIKSIETKIINVEELFDESLSTELLLKEKRYQERVIYMEYNDKGSCTKHTVAKNGDTVFSSETEYKYLGDKVAESKNTRNGQTTLTINSYDDNGKVTENKVVQDGMETITKYRYDNNVLAEVYNEMMKQTYTYNNGKLSQTTQHFGNMSMVSAYEYLGDTTIISVLDKDSTIAEQYTYLKGDRLVKHWKRSQYTAGGNTSTIEWDERNPVHCIEASLTPTGEIIPTGYASETEYLYDYEYDKQGNWTKRTATKRRNWGDMPSQVVEIIERTIIYY